MLKDLLARLEAISKSHLGTICTKKYFSYDFLDMTCNKLLLSKILSFGIVTGGLIVKLPQIIKLLSNGSATGISLMSLWIETSALLIAVIYNTRKGFPFMTFGESFFILIQNIILVSVVLYFTLRGASAKNSFSSIGTVVAVLWAVAVIGGGWYLYERVPFELISQLQSATIALLISARVPQIMMNWVNRSTGQLSFLTTFMIWAGSMARVFTTMQEIKDPKLLLSVSVSAFLNSVLLSQIFAYWSLQETTKNKTD